MYMYVCGVCVCVCVCVCVYVCVSVCMRVDHVENVTLTL